MKPTYRIHSSSIQVMNTHKNRPGRVPTSKRIIGIELRVGTAELALPVPGDWDTQRSEKHAPFRSMSCVPYSHKAINPIPSFVQAPFTDRGRIKIHINGK